MTQEDIFARDFGDVSPSTNNAPVDIFARDFGDVISKKIANEDSSALEKVGRTVGLRTKDFIEGSSSPSFLPADAMTALGNAALGAYRDAITPDERIWGGSPSRLADLKLSYPSEGLENLLTSEGLPTPKTPTERVDSDIFKALAGARSGIGIGNATEGPLGNFLSSYPKTQLASAASGAAASGLTRESDGGPIAQLAAGVLGGAAPFAAAPLASKGADIMKAIIQPNTAAGRESIANKVIDAFKEGQVNAFGTPNSSQLVPGSNPTAAEVWSDPGIAKLQDTLRDLNSKPFVERQAENDEARRNHFLQAAGTPEDIESAVLKRNDNASKTLGKLFENTTPTSAQPVVDMIDDILSGPGGKRGAVVQVMKDVRSKLTSNTPSENTAPPLYDASGNIMNATSSKSKVENDPETLYQSVRKHIDDLMDKKDLTSAAGKQAGAQLLQVKGALDNVIEQGAPGFQKYLSEYTDASKPINAMKWMQGLNLTDSQGNITLPKVQSALKNVQNLQNTPGISNAKSLTDNQVETLRNLRDDLFRQKNLTIGKSFGSPTVQKGSGQNKLQSLIPGQEGLFSGKMNPEVGGAVVGGALGNLIGIPGLGATAGSFAGRAINKSYNANAQQIRNLIENKLLNPQSYTPVINNNSVITGGNQNSLIDRLRSIPIGSALTGFAGANNPLPLRSTP